MRTAISLSAVLAVVAIGACADNNLEPGKKPGSDVIDFGEGSGTEKCGNGLDDDKNGLVDEGCVCEPGSTQICCATGAQQGGQQTCYLQNNKENAIGSWGPCEGAQGGDCYGGDSNSGPTSGNGSGDMNTTSGTGPGSGSGDMNTTSGTGPGSGSGDMNTTSGAGAGSGTGDNNTTSGAGAGSGTGDFNTTSGAGASSGTGDFNTTSGAGANSGTGDFNTSGSGSGDFLTSGAGPGSGSGDNNTSGAGAGSGTGSGSGTGDNNTSGAGAGSSSSGGGDECICAPGTWRWCDTPEACLWGVQICAPDFSWGKCNESNNAPSGCQPGVYDMGCCLNHPAACCENPFNKQSMGECTQQLDCN